jgi:serine/threonine-protein kinase
MALGAALASQALELGFGAVRATATPLPTATPAPTQTPVPTPTETPAPTATPVPTVPVPALVGETQRRAEERLQQAGLAVGEVVRIFDARPAGNVVAQEPAANESLETGQPVKLTVSLGPQQVRVPNVLSKDAKGATDAITQAGLTAKAVEQFNAQIQAGVVYDQQPRGEAQVNRGSTVTYYVSKGKEQVAVPVVRGKQEDEARRILEQAGLKVVVKYEAYSQADTYQVFAVVPPEGSPLDRGAEVTIRVRLDPTATPGPPAPAPTPRPGQTPARPSGQAQPSDNPRGRDRGA